jgi:hypothetical protein
MLRINISGKVIDPNNRSFRAEAKLPNDPGIRPNQIAQVRSWITARNQCDRHPC